MKIIVVDDGSAKHTYRALDPDAFSEAEFEMTVAKTLSYMYSSYRCIIFNGSFRYDDRVYRPDLALVARDYSHWFIIEVELVSHSFEGHVLPQVLAFRYGEPQSDCIGVLSRQLGESAESVKTLLEHVPRSVVVIVNKRESRWQVALGSHSIQTITLSLYRSELGVEAVEIDGTLEVLKESIGFGTYSAVDRSLRFPRTVRLPAGTVQINDPEGGLSLWTIVRDGDSTWVTKDVGTPHIPDGSYIQIIRTARGDLSLRRPA